MTGAIDVRIFHYINNAWANPFLDNLMPLISEFGSGEFIFLLAVALLILRFRNDRGRLGIFLLAGLTVTYYVVAALKVMIARPRPFEVIAQTRLLTDLAGGFSFPSNHAASAFMAATILSGFFRRWRAPLFMIAAVVAFSRIYLGVHYPSDVIAGAAIGTLAGYVILKVSREEQE